MCRSMVLPSYNRMLSDIEVRMNSSSITDQMKSALTKGWEKLREYYNYLDETPAVTCAWLLDPRYNLQFVKKIGYYDMYQSSVDTAIEYMKDLVKESRESQDGQERNEDGSRSNNNTDSVGMDMDDDDDGGEDVDSLFYIPLSDVRPIASEEIENEVDMYLMEQSLALVAASKKEKVSLEKYDPLMWWRKNESSYPFLSKIAMSLLATPGGAVSTERLFNAGRDVIGIRRASLSSGSIGPLMFGYNYLLKSSIYESI